ncbi:MAG: DNA-3-methyladenine glycosylase I [Casimicrobiaceae bacterium]|nr:DNA-3-methyladenine glycosylase I [Casimicrobiaceae bacterium]
MKPELGDRPPRCPWATRVPDFYVRYHDEEWGVPCFDEARMFEMLILELMQAGLSWRTVLAKREQFRRAFDGFDPERIARYGESDLARLMADPGIIRNRLKIRAAIDNARALLRLRDRAVRPEFALTELFWSVVDGRPRQRRARRPQEIPVKTRESDVLARELKRLGFRFVGSITVYAQMQACGLFNDHLTACWRHDVLVAIGQATAFPVATTRNVAT